MMPLTANSNMLASREHQEEIALLAEILEYEAKALTLFEASKDQKYWDLYKECEANKLEVMASLERGDWKERQKKADAHCARRGCKGVAHICWRYGL